MFTRSFGVSGTRLNPHSITRGDEPPNGPTLRRRFWKRLKVRLDIVIHGHPLQGGPHADVFLLGWLV